ncbi:hypothetical protein like AT5G25430 [Hibiscus trionum]|uniref:Bicarbonate transporter-like transmembrane domain-containing protein n=1 Tax=Hibiscus trionum TaxID=183268 RepID=A0A9W7MSX6_HIBTR|nr:hypothetical protein like AT5G25430 [Hibiscus trionum]
MIAGLYFFDHSVASQLAQQKEFNLKNPPAYHYNVLLLGVLTLICGLLGLPPSNGVLPQSPMHTKSLSVLKKQVIWKKMVKGAKEGMIQHASNSKIYGRMRAVFIEMDQSSPPAVDNELRNLKEAVMKSDSADDAKENFDPKKDIDPYLPIRVNEQRVSNLLQSLLVGLSMCALPVIKMTPTSVLWGYFAYMAIDSLPGNQFWERLLLLFVTPSRRYKVLEGDHASFVESVFQIHLDVYIVPICVSSDMFRESTSFQSFSIMNIFRNSMLPSMKRFPVHHRETSKSRRKNHVTHYEEYEDDFYDAEVLDGITTNRGELKLRSKSPKEEGLYQGHPEEQAELNRRSINF